MTEEINELPWQKKVREAKEAYDRLKRQKPDDELILEVAGKGADLERRKGRGEPTSYIAMDYLQAYRETQSRLKQQREKFDNKGLEKRKRKTTRFDRDVKGITSIKRLVRKGSPKKRNTTPRSPSEIQDRVLAAQVAGKNYPERTLQRLRGARNAVQQGQLSEG